MQQADGLQGVSKKMMRKRGEERKGTEEKKEEEEKDERKVAKVAVKVKLILLTSIHDRFLYTINMHVRKGEYKRIDQKKRGREKRQQG